MTPSDQIALRSRALKAYERGRLAHALGHVPFVLAMVALSLVAGDKPSISIAAGGALMLLAVAFSWRGVALGRAVVPGLIAASPPLVLPLLMRSGGHCCVDGICWSWCMLGCMSGGLLAGLVVGLSAASERRERGLFLCAATSLAGIGGVLGCAVAGAAGMIAVTVVALAASVPVTLLARMPARQ